MFTQKKTQLFDNTKVNKTKATNAFVNTAMKNDAETVSGNGAKKYAKHNDAFVTQFNMLGTYKAPRSFSLIEKDQNVLWAEDPLLTVKFSIFLRMITRTTVDMHGNKFDEAQKGGELKHEGIMRMIWLHQKSPETFWKNVTIFIAAGSWKDIFTMLRYDLVYNGWDNRMLDWNKFGNLIVNGLNNENQCNLIKKYLPTIKAKSKCTTVEAQANTMIGKWIASLLFDNKTYENYRKMKSSGTAHSWQKLISQGKHELIDFDSIHGRALNLLVRSRYLTNQGLSDKYANWIEKDSTEAKYTGYVHELFEKLPYSLSSLEKNKYNTINKQFETLVNKAGDKKETSLIVVRDTSGSMTSTAKGTNMTSYDVAKAMALYFSEFLTGHFEDAWIEFNSGAKMHKWKGANALDRWYNDHTSCIASTDFLSVIKLFIDLKNQGVAESDFPTGILCISDGEFNPGQLGKTNVESAKGILKSAGFSKEYVDNFVICLWNIPNSYYRDSTPKFESFDNVPNVFYMSGYSASIVSFLMEGVKNAKELFNEAMNQQLLSLVKL